MEKRIVCAALRAEDGDILIGIRHYSSDMIKQMDSRGDGYKFKKRHGDDQGFVDQFGNYYNRKDAYAIAEKANQIVRRCSGDGEELFSENLY